MDHHLHGKDAWQVFRVRHIQKYPAPNAVSRRTHWRSVSALNSKRCMDCACHRPRPRGSSDSSRQPVVVFSTASRRKGFSRKIRTADTAGRNLTSDNVGPIVRFSYDSAFACPGRSACTTSSLAEFFGGQQMARGLRRIRHGQNTTEIRKPVGGGPILTPGWGRRGNGNAGSRTRRRSRVRAVPRARRR
jgi:hypothetical protein